MKPRLVVVGGTWNQNGGSPSKLVHQLGSQAAQKDFDLTVRNGGYVSELRELLNDLVGAESVIWMPNVSNDVADKVLPDIKKRFPRLVLVQSKRIVEKSYDDTEVIGRLLATHSALGVTVRRKETGRLEFAVLDPLGNEYARSEEFSLVANRLLDRIEFILSGRRVRSTCVGPARLFTISERFLQSVTRWGARFSELMDQVRTERFLGNAATRTRCESGFPATKQGGRIFVSRRNIDKRDIGPGGFVEVQKAQDGSVEYYGDAKPSVDTPIQLALFEHYTAARFIIHGHCYLDTRYSTAEKIPCGDVREVDEIVSVVPQDIENFGINLLGHGCLLVGNDLDVLDAEFVASPRPFPES
jgi:hypothetical protein